MADHRAPRGTRRIGIAASLALAASLLAQVTPAVPGAPGSGSGGGTGLATAAADAADVQDHIARVNAERASAGVGALVVDTELQAASQQFSQVLADAGQLSHAPNRGEGVTTPYDLIDESVAMGTSTENVIRGLVNDPPHRDLMVRASHDRIGVGVTWRNGTQWVVHRYLSVREGGAPPPPPSPPPPPAPTVPPAPGPVPTVLPTPTPSPVAPVDGRVVMSAELREIEHQARLRETLRSVQSSRERDLRADSMARERPPMTRPQVTLVHLQARNCHNSASTAASCLGRVSPPPTPSPGTSGPAGTTASTRSSTTTTTRPRTSTTRPPPNRPTDTTDNVFSRVLGREDKTRVVLFVHGINATSNSTDCGDAFDQMIGWLRGYGFTGEMVKVGYYSGDINCDVNLHNYGTYRDNASWRRIAMAFSQFVYRKYTSKGIPVDVVGYSMGGLITRGAIYGSSRQQAGFAPPIDVEDVVTLGTPHNGAPLGWWCWSGTQCSTLANGHPDLNWLNQNGNPQGRRGTEFTVIGSDNDWVVSVPSALFMSVPRARKVRFGDLWVNGQRQQVSHTGNTNYMHNAIVVRRAAVALALPGQ